MRGVLTDSHCLRVRVFEDREESSTSRATGEAGDSEGSRLSAGDDTATAVVVANRLADVLYAWLDPRIGDD
ncbi:MAG: hypothetical protein ABEJ73_10705 [Haloplanus sp.]